MSYRYYTENEESFPAVVQLLDDIKPLLSARELEVFELWRQGASGVVIAELLGIKKQTVHVYQQRIIAKGREKITGYDFKNKSVADFVEDAEMGDFHSTSLSD